MIARVRAPSPPLRSHVEYLWYHEGVDWAWERLLPDGAIELVVDLRDGPKRWGDGDRQRITTVNRSWISGQHSRPIAVEAAQGSCMIGAHFRPGGAFPFVGGTVADLNDRVIEMDLVWGSCAGELRERLLEATDVDTRFTILEDALIGRATSGLTIDPSLACALRCLQVDSEAITIRRLADQVGVSHKRLIGLFERQVGLTPKLFSRIMRLQRMLKHLDRAPSTSWSVLAAEHGWVDQAHLVKDFSALTGLTPTRYFKDKGDSLNWVPLA